MEINKKNIVITGAGSGIGQAILNHLNFMFDCIITATNLNTDHIKDSSAVFTF